MIRYILTMKSRNGSRKKIQVRNAINTTISKNGIVVSHAKTAKEICASANYNRSIEMPICGMGKL